MEFCDIHIIERSKIMEIENPENSKTLGRRSENSK